MNLLSRILLYKNFLIIYNFLSKDKVNKKVLLGRWNIETCNKKINIKIDLANKDNCGVCDEKIQSFLNTK